MCSRNGGSAAAASWGASSTGFWGGELHHACSNGTRSAFLHDWSEAKLHARLVRPPACICQCRIYLHESTICKLAAVPVLCCKLK